MANYDELTSGTNGGWDSLLSRPSQSIPANQGWRRISSNPCPLGRQPNRVMGSRSINWKQFEQVKDMITELTHAFQSHYSLITATLRRIFRELEWVPQNSLCHSFRTPAIERAFVEDEFISSDAKAPPVDVPRIALFVDNLRSHVRHTSSDTRVQSAFGIMDSNVEIGDVCMSHSIQ